MSNFILPVTIESRRIVFLDLQAKPLVPDVNTDTGEDVFVVEIPGKNTNPLFSISKAAVVQSLLNDYTDIPVNSLSSSLEYDEDKRIITVLLSQKPSTPAANEPIPLDTGLRLVFDTSGPQLLAELSAAPDIVFPAWDSLLVVFKLEPAEGNFTYSTVVRYYLVERAKIKFAGLDFGSEASQMYYASHNEAGILEQLPDNLFVSVKNDLGIPGKDYQNFLQFEKGSNFFKSIFFADKTLKAGQGTSLSNVYTFTDSLNMMTRSADLNEADFFTERTSIPNLKIIHGNTEFANTINFDISSNGSTSTKSLVFLKDSIYASLLHRIIGAFVKSKIEEGEDAYLRFCVLVPNIYSIHEVVKVKKIIRHILKSVDKKNRIKGVEIWNLSESDASFLGSVRSLNLEAGGYYIIIDSGKGTTDFSVIRLQNDYKNICRPVYRNGFTGAGNLISFAFLQSVLHYIRSLGDAHKKSLAEFIRINMSTNTMNDFTYELYQHIEKWKKNYSTSGKTQAQVEEEWATAKSGERTLSDLFQTVPLSSDVLDLLRTIENVYDWNGYVAQAIDSLVNNVATNLEPIIEYLNQDTKCGGVLMTGRAFHFVPLKNAMLGRLRDIKGMANIQIRNNDELDLKEVCMQGIFEPNIQTYSDVASIPIEVRKGTNQVMKRSYLGNFFTRTLKQIVSLVQSQSGMNDSEHYSQESNNLPVINVDLINTQFLASGKVLQPVFPSGEKVKEAHLIQSRSGINIRLKDMKGRIKVINMQEADQQKDSFRRNDNNIKKSLFPGVVDVSLFDQT